MVTDNAGFRHNTFREKDGGRNETAITDSIIIHIINTKERWDRRVINKHVGNRTADNDDPENRALTTDARDR